MNPYIDEEEEKPSNDFVEHFIVWDENVDHQQDQFTYYIDHLPERSIWLQPLVQNQVFFFEFLCLEFMSILHNEENSKSW